MRYEPAHGRLVSFPRASAGSTMPALVRLYRRSSERPGLVLYEPAAARVLAGELAHDHWVPRPVALLGEPDPYPSVEDRLRITRDCLAVCAERGQAVTLTTRNHLVLRDADLLEQLAVADAVRVCVPLESLVLSQAIAPATVSSEPGASPPSHRLHALYRLSSRGVPVGVELPARTDVRFDTELVEILQAARHAGASWATIAGTTATGRRRPGCVTQRFRLACARLGLDEEPPGLSTRSFRADPRQLTLL